MNEYKYTSIKMTPFKWFVLENFPFIEEDFDSLTNYGLYCKLKEYFDKVAKNVNDMGNQVENLTIAFKSLQNYVENYFTNLDVQEEINNKIDELVESGVMTDLILQNRIITKKKFSLNTLPMLQKASSIIAKNCVWVTNSGNLFNEYYHYSDRHQISVEEGRQALKENIDDIIKTGTEEIFLIAKFLLNENQEFYLGGGYDFINDLVWAKNYIISQGLKCDTLRIIQNTSTSTILTSSQITQYKNLLSNLIDYVDGAFDNFIILNELESLLNTEDGETFASQCISICHNNDIKVSISMSNNLLLNETLLNMVDFISYNFYQPVQFNTDKIVYTKCTEALLLQKPIFDYLKSFNKPLVISEFGCRDNLWSLGNPAGSSVPQGYDVSTNGETISYMIDGFFEVYGNIVDKFAIWYDDGFFYKSNENDKIECQKKNRDVINKWRGVEINENN